MAQRFLTALILFVITPVAFGQILIEDPKSTTVPRLGDRGIRAQNTYQQPPAQPVPDSEGIVQPPARTGKGAATDYFRRRAGARSESVSSDRTVAAGGSDHILGLSVGTFINDKNHRWGSKDRGEDAGELMLGVTYRVGEWTSSMDMNFRAEIISYDIDDETPVKLSVMPLITFPDARSEFPMYFGAGAGVGIFFEQIDSESDLSLDYALVIGARFLDIFENGGGLFVETGLKGHIFVTSSGQQDGVFLAGGAMFAF